MNKLRDTHTHYVSMKQLKKERKLNIKPAI